MVSPEALRRYALFAGLPPAAFTALAQIAEEVTLEEDAFLFEEGAPAEELFLVVDGVLDLLFNLDEAGERMAEVESLVQGEAAGWSALIEPHVYSMSGVASVPTTVIALDGAGFREYLAANPGEGLLVYQQIAQSIAQRLNNMRLRLISLTE